MKQTMVIVAIIVGLMLLVIEKNNFAREPQTSRVPRPAIARMWHGQTSAARAKEYTAYLQEAGIKKIQSIPGNLGVQMFRKLNQDTADFVVISYWDSVESIKKFAGEEYENVRQLPRDPEFLIRPEAKVQHYEVVVNQLTE